MPVVLVVTALLFLFSGLYKGLIWSPIDLTIATGAVLCITLLASRTFDFFRTPGFLVFAALCAYLAIRLFPDPTWWGQRKLAELVLFGIPALWAGYAVMRMPGAFDFLVRALAFATIPLSIAIAAPIATNGIGIHGIGSGGYQLTGYFAALCFIASVSIRNIWLSVLGALALAGIGSLSGAMFGAAGAAVVLICHGHWRRVAIAASLALCAVAFVAVALPQYRIAWKAEVLWHSFGRNEIGRIFRGTDSTFQRQPGQPRPFDGTESAHNQNYDRPHMFAEAARIFTSFPALGIGYGAVTYLGHPYPHNAIFELAAEGGLVALALLTGWLAVAGRHLALMPPFVLGSTTLALLTAMTNGYFGTRIFLFILGMAAASLRTTAFSSGLVKPGHHDLLLRRPKRKRGVIPEHVHRRSSARDEGSHQQRG